MKVSAWFGIVFFSFMVSSQPENKFTYLVYRKPGNVTITGIFNSHKCDMTMGRELQEMAAAIWTEEALNNYNYVTGITIGLSLYRTCGEVIPNAIMTLIEEDVNQNKDELNMGILTSFEIHKKVEHLERIENKRMAQVEHIIKADMLVDLTVQLLTNLQWMIINAVAADSEIVLNSFSEKTSDEGICIHDELLITNRGLERPLNETRNASVVIVIAEFPNIIKILPEFQNVTTLIVAPTDFHFYRHSDFPENTIVLLPSMNDENILHRYIKSKRYQSDVFNHKEPTKSPLFIGVAATILKLLQPFKKLQEENCQHINYISKQSCIPVTEFMDNLKDNKTALMAGISTRISVDDIMNVLEVLKIDSSSNDEMFLYITSLIQGNYSEDFGIFQIFSLKTKTFRPVLLKINDNLLEGLNNSMTQYKYDVKSKKAEDFVQENMNSNPFSKLWKSLTSSVGNLKKGNETDVIEPCDISNDTLHECQNFGKNHTNVNPVNVTGPTVVWRFLTWVSINTSVGFMGVVCTLSIMFFIISRICRGDILEGSPYFTLLLMFAVIFIFTSSLSYHMNIPSHQAFICSLRINIPPLAYAILFSLLLSRSLMLASADGGGFVSHINGYIQSILCFFMLCVQLSLFSQNWKENIFQVNCGDLHEKFIISLGYDFLLLALLACVSPFTIRSKRNYKEGLLFSISIFFIIVAWSAWISLYFLLPSKHKDAAVACGLNSTGIVILFCVFIPRTYLMAAAIVRDRTARSLPALDRNILTESSDVNYKSNQTLNDSVFGTITYKSCEMGLNNPNFYTGRSNEGSRETINENLNREPNVSAAPNVPVELRVP